MTRDEKERAQAGKVLILNGTSSAGKTALAKGLQEALDDCFLYCSLDMFWDMTPVDVPAGSHNFPDLKRAMAKAVRALAETGHNVIVDTIHKGGLCQQEMLTELEGLEIRKIKVACGLTVLRQRESARSDRRIGLAQSQIHSVHDGVIYDFEIDTSDASCEACVNQIQAYLVDTWGCLPKV